MILSTVIRNSARKIVVNLSPVAHCALDLSWLWLLCPLFLWFSFSFSVSSPLSWQMSVSSVFPSATHHHIHQTWHKIVTRMSPGLTLSKGPSAADLPLPEWLRLWQVLQAKIEVCGSCSWNSGDSAARLGQGSEEGLPVSTKLHCPCLSEENLTACKGKKNRSHRCLYAFILQRRVGLPTLLVYPVFII